MKKEHNMLKLPFCIIMVYKNKQKPAAKNVNNRYKNKKKMKT